MPDAHTSPEPSKTPPRLAGDTLADRLDRLFAAFPNPATGKPWTNVEIAEALTAAGCPIVERTLENYRSRKKPTSPNAQKLSGMADHFDIDPSYLLPGSRADERARLAEQDAVIDPDFPLQMHLDAIARMFKTPEYFFEAGPQGEKLDAELELFIAMRSEDVRSVALRYHKADATTKRSVARQLHSGGPHGRPRGPKDGDDGA